MRLKSQDSPLLSLIQSPSQDDLVDAIDTCRIFDDSYDFWDEFGDGWAVLVLSVALNDKRNDGASAEFSRWFVQSSGPDIKAYYDKDRISNIIDSAGCGMLDSIGLLLELGPPGTVDREVLGITPLLRSIRARDYDKMKALLALGANPHQSSFLWHIDRKESPLSLAMYSLWAFCFFRDALYEKSLHVEDIVRRELENGGPLLDDGWQPETLSTLLKFDFELEIGLPEGIKNVCSNCDCHIFDGDFRIQPYWQDILERIKNGTYVQKPYSDTQDLQTSSSQTRPLDSGKMPLTNTADGGALSQNPALSEDQSQQSDEEPVVTENALSSFAPGKQEMWCFKCWTHFKKTGRRYSPPITEMSTSDGDDSSENEFSPFLFNT